MSDFEWDAAKDRGNRAKHGIGFELAQHAFMDPLRVIAEEGKSLRELCEGMQKYPQILLNVKVAKKVPFDDLPQVKQASKELEKDLKGNGRLLLRYSGTENLARVMIEGQDQQTINAQAESLAELIRKELG